MNILITSVGTATSVNLIKHFRKNGVYVVGTDVNNYGMTAGSQLVDKFVKVPLAIEPSFWKSILTIVEKEKIDVAIPINDIEVYIFSQKIRELKCKCLIPDTATIDILRDKYLCSRKIEKAKILVPEIKEIDTLNERRILRDRIGVGSKGVTFIEEGKMCPNYEKNEKFLQRCVEGEEYTIDVLADEEGKPIYIVPRKRIEVKSGVATKVAIIKDDKLIEYSETILNIFKLPGFSNIQFIKDEQGNYWFIEVNYRFSGCGAATLATSPLYLKKFISVIKGDLKHKILNEDTKWNTVVTRYYEEIVYENSIS